MPIAGPGERTLSAAAPMIIPRVALLCGLLAASLPIVNALELAPAFTDHAVLQRDVAVPIWGWDDQPGATVTVTYGGQTRSTQVNASGIWRADLLPLAARAEGSDLTVVRGNVKRTIRDVVVGEVWLISGQSNMEWGLDVTKGYDDEKAKPANPLLRQLYVNHVGADLPVTKVRTSGWQVAAPETVGRFSGVGYFFARQLAEKLSVPVGLINASWGGTAIESWIPEPVLRTSRSWPKIQAGSLETQKNWPETYAAQPGLEAAWRKAWEENKATGKPVTMQWPRPPGGPGSGFSPARLFNGMIAPFVPYALRGALWYQGESNVGRHREYAELLPAMIQGWRAAWPLGDFPFFVVQLPNYASNGKPDARDWAFFREAQASVEHLPAVAVAVTIDGNEPTDLHPKDKRPVGERLAGIALHRVYDQRAVVWSGPVVQATAREGAAIRVRFSAAAGLRSTSEAITGFELAGADRVFHAATGRIEGETVVVTSPNVSEPVAVRYAFLNVPNASLVNGAGLPASPFRTDDW
jgi:sialate O-acetylesterase